jgi:hypothetical protein
LNIHHSIDSIYFGRAVGWAFGANGQSGNAEQLRIEVWHEDICLGRTVANLARFDVGDAYPMFKNSAFSGFDVEFQLPNAATEIAEIRFQAVASAPDSIRTPHLIGTAQVPTRRSFDAILAVRHEDDRDDLAVPVALIPRELAGIVERLWPGFMANMSGDDAQAQLVDKILFVVQGLESQQLSKQLSGVLSYVRFLRTTWAHFQYVSRYFPSVNSSVPVGSKDSYNKQNTAKEMFSIAHHLYVLKSFGVTGDFVEFGCFKGFSSSMLSYACHSLGIRMHIFDSFEGLPPSDSAYYRAGDFRGDLEEVERNIEHFGVPSSVIYHKGFFAKTIPLSSLSNLISLWMDVDLASSSTDVMSIAPKIDPRGAIFSHECEAKNFVGGTIVAAPDSVIPPILDHFKTLGTKPTGRFLAGNTGAFWRSDRGIPVLSAAALTKLMLHI